jgi:hypothetical protein
MKLELLFKILAVIFIGIAAFFLWRGSPDGTFVAFVLSAVCFFLSVRFQITARNKQREKEKLLGEKIEAAREETSPKISNEQEEIRSK